MQTKPNEIIFLYFSIHDSNDQHIMHLTKETNKYYATAKDTMQIIYYARLCDFYIGKYQVILS